MKGNNSLKHGLIIQSLSPLFLLLIIRHVHCDYCIIVHKFFDVLLSDPIKAMKDMALNSEFGEILIVSIGVIWIIISIIYIPAFKGTQEACFESHGECVKNVEERKGDAASFLMTFILPLLVDELSSPQYWISYLLVILIVYIVLYKSNLYYQSPILAILKYRVFIFEVSNPDEKYGLKGCRRYVGITRDCSIYDGDAVIWKHIADDVFLVYKE